MLEGADISPTPSLKGLYDSIGPYLSNMVNMGKSGGHVRRYEMIWIDGADDRARCCTATAKSLDFDNRTWYTEE